MPQLKVKLVRSPIGSPQDQKATVRALGLKRLNQTVIHSSHPTILGMVRKVKHLIDVEVVEESRVES
ncbi:MAG: 50S ribosomal protein L30 [Abditibacteriales bacterium]|nr:50S ribosomal protein L30 [Abditibacteriales bacterium]